MNFNKERLSQNSLKGKAIFFLKEEMISKTLRAFNINNKSLLILDNKSSKIISSYLTMSEVLNLGIFSIDLIFKSRQPFQELNAIYFISTSDKSIEKLLEDFDKKKRLYKKCHVFFCEPISDEKLDKLVNKDFINRICTCKELDLTFITPDQNLFCFGEINNFNSLYQNIKGNLNNEIILITIEKLLSVCNILNQYPNIIYFKCDKICEKIAKLLNNRLKERKNLKSKNGILLITSRLIDLTAPLLFDLSFESLIFDYYKIKNYNQIDHNKIDLILNESNPLYSKYKNLSLPVYLTTLSKDFDDFMKSDISKIGKTENLNDFEDMAKAVKNLGEYKYLNNLFSKNLSIGKEISEKYNDMKILDVINIQNSILSGIDDKGKRITNKEIFKELKKLQKNLNTNEMIRLLSITKFFHNDFDIEDAIGTFNDEINNNIKIKYTDKKKINFFSMDNIQIDKDNYNELDKSIISYRLKHNYKTKEEEENKSDKRFVCYKESKLTTLCDMCSKNELPKSLFEFVESPENLIKVEKKKYKTNYLFDEDDDNNNINTDKSNLILFNVGGISRYEICSIEKGVLNGQFNYNIIMGANTIYNSENFLNEVDEYLKGNDGIIEIKEINDETLDAKDVKIDVSDNNFL